MSLKELFSICLAMVVVAFLSGAAFAEDKCLETASSGQLEKTIQICTEEIESGQHDNLQLVMLYNLRGGAYGDTGHLDLAIADFNRAIELAPSDAHGYGGLGMAYERKGQHNLAVFNCKKAMHLDPGTAKDLCGDILK